MNESKINLNSPYVSITIAKVGITFPTMAEAEKN